MNIKGYNVNYEDGTIEIVANVKLYEDDTIEIGVNLKLEDYLLMLYKIGAISSDELGKLAVEHL